MSPVEEREEAGDGEQAAGEDYGTPVETDGEFVLAEVDRDEREAVGVQGCGHLVGRHDVC